MGAAAADSIITLEIFLKTHRIPIKHNHVNDVNEEVRMKVFFASNRPFVIYYTLDSLEFKKFHIA